MSGNAFGELRDVPVVDLGRCEDQGGQAQESRHREHPGEAVARVGRDSPRTVKQTPLFASVPFSVALPRNVAGPNDRNAHADVAAQRSTLQRKRWRRERCETLVL